MRPISVTDRGKKSMEMNYSRRAIAGVTALLLALSLSACDSDEEPNGTDGG